MAERRAKVQRFDNKGRALGKGESQLPDGRYMYRYTDIYGNRKKVYSWRLIYTDVAPKGKRSKKSIDELKAEINADKVKNIDNFSSNNTTLNSRWEMYLKELVIRETTRANYIYLWDKHIRNTLGNLKVADINSSIIASRYVEFYTENCYALSTIESIHNLISPVFDVCIEDHLLTTNPSTRAIKKIRNIESRHKKKEDETEERVILTPEQETAFLEFVCNDKRCKNWKNLFIILLKTGARISEICGLTKKDVKLKDGYIHLRQQLLYRKINDKCQRFVSPLKTGAGNRKIPIYCEELENALKEQLNLYTDNGIEIDGIDGWIFRNRYNNALSENNANDGLRRVLGYYNRTVTDKNLKIKNFSCHNFRHTFASKCEEKDVSERVTKALLGHSRNKKDVTNRYVHLTFEYIQKETNKLNED